MLQGNDADRGNGNVFVPEMGRTGSSGYSDAHYKFLTELIESKSAREYYIQILGTDFSHQCVNAFFKVLTSGFDKNAILARNDNLDIRILDFEIALNLMVLECHESDIQNPAFMTFCENIRQMFKDFISRSKDASERDKLLKQEYGVSGQSMNQSPQAQQPDIAQSVRRFGRSRGG